jgi:hypothetical protein
MMGKAGLAKRRHMPELGADEHELGPTACVATNTSFGLDIRVARGVIRGIVIATGTGTGIDTASGCIWLLCSTRARRACWRAR